MIRVLVLLILLTGCSQKQVATHMGTGVGAVTGYTTCRGLLNTNVELTAACTVIGAMWGSSIFYQNELCEIIKYFFLNNEKKLSIEIQMRVFFPHVKQKNIEKLLFAHSNSFMSLKKQKLTLRLQRRPLRLRLRRTSPCC